ncbi:hypothetical protein FRX31_014345 [Thalictrum thalictroides]|uniref:Uncharacterized protein n=1 Tax=Thalictrum thalictroides TaxID=46969 RepID=A0A7J6WGL4_THATH|nr:hypothetical protein FRX31_014345 [Thalictrum thalictroides]
MKKATASCSSDTLSASTNGLCLGQQMHFNEERPLFGSNVIRRKPIGSLSGSVGIKRRPTAKV